MPYKITLHRADHAPIGPEAPSYLVHSMAPIPSDEITSCRIKISGFSSAFMVCHKPKYGRTTLLVTPPEALFDEKLAISIDVCCLVAWRPHAFCCPRASVLLVCARLLVPTCLRPPTVCTPLGVCIPRCCPHASSCLPTPASYCSHASVLLLSVHLLVSARLLLIARLLEFTRLL